MCDSDSEVLQAVRAWQEIAAKIEQHRLRMIVAEDSDDTRAIFLENDIADTLFKDLQAARQSVYTKELTSVRAAAAVLCVMRASEQDAFEDTLLAKAMDNVIESLLKSNS